MREKLIELLDGIQSHGWRRIETDHSITLAVVENKAIAEHLIRSGVTIQQWIPVTERLPEEFHSVLICVPTDSPLPVVKEAYLANGCWATRMWGYSQKEVSHWMPLPEPPKEG